MVVSSKGERGMVGTPLRRMASFSKALGPVLSGGLAKGHLSNPAASIRALDLYATPILLSGVPTIPLSPLELTTISHHHNSALLKIQKLYPTTPHAFIHLLSGSLPFTATLHLRHLSLLTMIAHLGPTNILHQWALYSLHHDIPNSFFTTLHLTCSQYSLPDPLPILTNPQSKPTLKKLFKFNVFAFWHNKLCLQIEGKPSIQYFKPHFTPLGSPHQTTAIRQATIQARMLSGRFNTDHRRRWWANTSGACTLPNCSQCPGDLLHLLSGACPPLFPTQSQSISQWETIISSHSQPSTISTTIATILSTSSPAQFISFLLDPSTNPHVISLHQVWGNFFTNIFFQLTRTYIWSSYKKRLDLLGLSNFIII
jgi:hypothetical protein